MRNTHCSTAIEDNPLTLEQVRLIEEGHGLPAEPPRAKREVLNYLAGLCHIERHANKKRITHRDVFTLHTMLAAEVMDQGDAGRYTPPAPQLVSGFMAELLAWWNEPSREWSPVISSAVLHYRFEDIHPSQTVAGAQGEPWHSGSSIARDSIRTISFQWTKCTGKIDPPTMRHWQTCNNRGATSPNGSSIPLAPSVSLLIESGRARSGTQKSWRYRLS